ncbi:dipeptide epimerase [Fusibacter sp. JL216-2]|uniref:dipeptide epimerase n=1 Tax=Fusibacter sp. JL216-2 TaxID=3071453 RepID=UPI003D342B07
MILESIEIKQVDIPLEKPFKTALRTLSTVVSIEVTIKTNTGHEGYGAASPTAVITGDTIGSIKSAVQEIWVRIKGRSIDDWDTLMTLIDSGIVGNSSAKAAMDIALHDLRAKQYGVPLYKLLGGAKTQLETDMTVSLDKPEIMAQDAVNALRNGFRALKVKLGNDSEMDLMRMKAIYDAVGSDVKIRLDANQGWSRKEAVRSVLKMLDTGIDIQLVEQPVSAHDLDGMKYVTDNIPVAVLADESVFSYQDAIKIIQMGAADYLNIKLMKTGGIDAAMRITSFAQAYGIECMIGCMMEGPIGIAAAVHFGCGRHRVGLADLDVPSMYKGTSGDHDRGFIRENAFLRPRDLTGLGI